jgi:hypothetical protein
MQKIKEYLWVMLGFALLFSIMVFWSYVIYFFEHNSWYVNIAIFVGFGFAAERIGTWWENRNANHE